MCFSTLFPRLWGAFKRASTSLSKWGNVEIEEEATIDDDLVDENFEYDSKEEENYDVGLEDGSEDDDDNWD